MNEINEGLVFFKDSRRLMNLARTIRKKAVKTGTYNNETEDYISSVEILAKQFAELEDEYNKGDESYARAKYGKLKTQSRHLLDKIQKETFRKAIIGTGIGSALFLLVKLLTSAATSQPIAESNISEMKNIISEEDYNLLKELRDEAFKHGDKT